LTPICISRGFSLKEYNLVEHETGKVLKYNEETLFGEFQTNNFRLVSKIEEEKKDDAKSGTESRRATVTIGSRRATRMTKREAAQLLLEQSEETDVVTPLKTDDNTSTGPEKGSADSRSEYITTKSGSSDITQDVSITTVSLEASERKGNSEKKNETSRVVAKEISNSVDDGSKKESERKRKDLTKTEKKR